MLTNIFLVVNVIVLKRKQIINQQSNLKFIYIYYCTFVYFHIVNIAYTYHYFYILLLLYSLVLIFVF